MKNFAQKFNLQQLTVKYYQYWQLSVRPVQLTLGSLVLSLRRQCSSFAGLTADETSELALIFKETEQALSALFHFDKINYLALMMVDHQVHYHILPRYQAQRSFSGFTFEDKAWPGPVSDFQTGLSGSELLSQLKTDLSAKLSA